MRSVLAAALLAAAAIAPVQAAEPIKIGCSMAMTGGVAGIGKQILLALQIWRDQVNAKGGLLGRPVELDCYDDQSQPANVPGIYTKLIDIDKVDLLIGPYATNMIAPAIPVLMQKGKMTVGILGNAANHEFHYPRYFSMNVTGTRSRTLLFDRALCAGQCAEPAAADDRALGRRRRIRAQRDRRHAQERRR